MHGFHCRFECQICTVDHNLKFARVSFLYKRFKRIVHPKIEFPLLAVALCIYLDFFFFFLVWVGEFQRDCPLRCSAFSQRLLI